MIRFFLIFMICVFANAHSLKVFAISDGEFVEIKSYFYGNSPCKGCNVELIKDGKVLQNAKTDDNGFVRLKMPSNEFEILVDGSLAHEKRINFKSDENITKEQIEDSDLLSFAKIIGAIFLILAVFASLYFIKKR